MAEAKTGYVRHTESVGPLARLLQIEPDEPVPFVGGQYVIVDTGLLLPNGRAAKRAYSLISTDAQPGHFELVVKRIESGPGSGYLHGLSAGSPVRFSGPWGKFVLEPDASGPSLLFATDTGITAALSLLNSTRAEATLPDTELIWLRTNEEDFVSDAFVTARLPPALGVFRAEAAPPAHHPERVPHARAVLAARLATRRPVRAFVSGDGAVNYALLDDLNAVGVPTTRDQLESFFNMPKKSAASA